MLIINIIFEVGLFKLLPFFPLFQELNNVLQNSVYSTKVLYRFESAEATELKTRWVFKHIVIYIFIHLFVHFWYIMLVTFRMNSHCSMVPLLTFSTE